MMRNLFAAFVASVIFMGTAFGQAYPTKPISIVISFGPGGGTDLLARALGQAMEATLGQPIGVLNKPGGNSIIAADFVKNSPPDGYTPCSRLPTSWCSIRFCIHCLFAGARLCADFAGGAQGRTTIAGPNACQNSSRLLDFARATGKVSMELPRYARLLGDMIKLESKVDMLTSPTKVAGTIQAVLSGDVIIVIAVPISPMSTAASCSGRRNGTEEEELIPACRQCANWISGARGLGRYGLFAPAGTPQPIVDKPCATRRPWRTRTSSSGSTTWRPQARVRPSTLPMIRSTSNAGAG
jgi:hypothetical protein